MRGNAHASRLERRAAYAGAIATRLGFPWAWLFLSLDLGLDQRQDKPFNGKTGVKKERKRRSEKMVVEVRRARNLTLIALVIIVLGTIWFLVSGSPQEKSLTLATTTSTQDSGLLDVLVPAFEKETGIKVRVIAVGSGQAMELGKRGDADVLLVHSPQAEQEFVDGGYGVDRKPVMHNVFLIVGPKSDPAGVKGSKDASKAFRTIAESKAKFISRGDDSGTHKKELGLWEKAGVKPQGDWYVESGQGMGDTLLMASELGAYTLTDEATYLSMAPKLQLEVMVQGDKALSNPYSVIAVNPEKHKNVHYKAATQFIKFVTGEKGQSVIASFGRDKFGKSLFIPDAK